MGKIGFNHTCYVVQIFILNNKMGLSFPSLFSHLLKIHQTWSPENYYLHSELAKFHQNFQKQKKKTSADQLHYHYHSDSDSESDTVSHSHHYVA